MSTKTRRSSSPRSGQVKLKSKRGAPGSARSKTRPARLGEDHWSLRLYVAGQTPKSLTAFANLKRMCEEHLAGRYQIEVIDLVKAPQLAQGDQIVALPTLVRKLPEPIKRMVGDLSNLDRVMVGMDLRPLTVKK